jgi:hypothetical protein
VRVSDNVASVAANTPIGSGISEIRWNVITSALLAGTLTPALEVLELLLYGGSVTCKLFLDIIPLPGGKTNINNLLKVHEGS